MIPTNSNKLFPVEPKDRQPLSQFGSLAEQLTCWRNHLDQYCHPVVLFDGNAWPVVLNRTFQRLIMDSSPTSGGGRTVSSLWKDVCEATKNVVAKAISVPDRHEIAEFFPLHERCFVILGSLLRSPQGAVVGAVLNIAEIAPTAITRHPVFNSRMVNQMRDEPAISGSDAEGYADWLALRDIAQEKITLLSGRELQVASFVAEGYPNKRIALTLGVTVKTIEKHRANASAKLGAKNTAELVRIFVCSGHKNPPPGPATLN